MNIKEVINSGKVDFTGIEQSYFLLGLLSAFDNRFQAVADGTMQEISFLQLSVSICVKRSQLSRSLRRSWEALTRM